MDFETKKNIVIALSFIMFYANALWLATFLHDLVKGARQIED